MGDELTADGRVHDDYRIDYLRQHVQAIADAIGDGVEVMGYCPWSVMDLLSSHQASASGTALSTSTAPILT